MYTNYDRGGKKKRKRNQVQQHGLTKSKNPTPHYRKIKVKRLHKGNCCVIWVSNILMETSNFKITPFYIQVCNVASLTWIIFKAMATCCSANFSNFSLSAQYIVVCCSSKLFLMSSNSVICCSC